MFFPNRFFSIFALLAIAVIAGSETYLTATAVVSDPNGNARIQCWEFETPFSQYSTVGMALPFADVSNLTYVVLPPRSEEGLHKPPHVMMFVLLSGLAHVVLPDRSDEVWVFEGLNGLIVAADTIGLGHYTFYPSDKETVALQIPFAGGKTPPHKVLKQGACHMPSQVISHEAAVTFVEQGL